MKNLLDDPAVSGVVVNYSDISEQVLLEEELRHRALHDSLTGLPNRELFLDRIDHAVRRLRRSGGLVGMLFVDLDGFKSVNDRFGHGAGDRVLEITADRLRAVSRGTDSCARFGGDEFGVLLEDLHDPAAAGGIARRIVDTLTEPMDLDGQVVMIGASVGIALGTGPEGAEELIHRADLAMYRAKTEGKGRTAVYDLAAESHR
jgi:diguanylate cyclase (GGDEF)-like protein